MEVADQIRFLKEECEQNLSCYQSLQAEFGTKGADLVGASLLESTSRLRSIIQSLEKLKRLLAEKR